MKERRATDRKVKKYHPALQLSCVLKVNGGLTITQGFLWVLTTILTVTQVAFTGHQYYCWEKHFLRLCNLSFIIVFAKVGTVSYFGPV